MMEAGTLLASEVLPAVGREFALAARRGGALTQALKTVRVQQGRFFTELQKAQDKIFKGGFGEGFAKLLKNLTILFKDTTGLAEAMGAAFNGVFSAFAGLVKLISIPLKVLSALLSRIKDNFGEVASGAALLTIIALPALVKAFKAVKFILVGVNLQLAVTVGRMGLVMAKALAALAIIAEIIALTTKGVTGDIENLILGRDVSVGGAVETIKSAISQERSTGRGLKFIQSASPLPNTAPVINNITMTGDLTFKAENREELLQEIQGFMLSGLQN